MRLRHTPVLLLLTAPFVLLGDSPAPDIHILASGSRDSVACDQGDLVVVSMAKTLGTDLVVSTQWSREKIFPIDSKASREGFAKEFYKLFEPRTTIELVSYSFRFFSGYTKPESLKAAFTDTLSLRALWQRKEFVDLLKNVQLGNATELLVAVRGWRDSVWTTPYDDPAAESRSLFKIHLHLLPGPNLVYFSAPGGKDRALGYATTVVNDVTPVASRSARFHDSQIEQGCTACHEGLPAGTEGKEMTADCGTCHKAFTLGMFIHAPVEMNQCGSCHSWSVPTRSVAVEKGVPTVCYECHIEKQAVVDTSVVPHPVASDCLVCHSPHAGDQAHMLKQTVYTLCTGCHEKYAINHPVGKHPLRLVMLAGSNEEISCVSCHEPHGSANHALLKVPGGAMEICIQCHQK